MNVRLVFAEDYIVSRGRVNTRTHIIFNLQDQYDPHIVRYVRYPDRALLKEVLGGQYNYKEGERQVLRQGAYAAG